MVGRGGGVNQRGADSMDDDIGDVTSWLMDRLEEIYDRVIELIKEHQAWLKGE
jgi:hypothetical protein